MPPVLSTGGIFASQNSLQPGTVTGMTTPFITSEPPAIRSENDIIAYALTTLGYWPQNSLVFVLSGTNSVGPILRIDLNLQAPETASGAVDVLAQTFATSPQLAQGTPQIFALFFADSYHPRNQQATAPFIVLDDESWQAEQTAPFMREIHRYAEYAHLKVADALFIGENNYWGVLYPDRPKIYIGENREIIESRLNTYMITQGHTIGDTQDSYLQANTWNADDASRAGCDWASEANTWYEVYRMQLTETGFEGHRHYRRQLQAQLSFWNIAIKEIENLINKERRKNRRQHRSFSLVDHLAPESVRSIIPPQLAGYLAAHFHEASFVHHLIYLGLTNLRKSITIINSFQALSQHLEPQSSTTDDEMPLVLPIGINTPKTASNLAEELQAEDAIDHKPVTRKTAERNLDRLARALTGNLGEKPSWASIEALEVLCLILAQITQDHEKHSLYNTLAWTSWLKGYSSLATRYIDTAGQYPHETAPLLQAALAQSNLPEICLTPGHSWASYQGKDL